MPNLTREEALRQLETSIIYIVHPGDEMMASHVELLSNGTSRLLGYDSEEFAKNPGLWASILHPDDLANVTEQTEAMLRQREPRTRFYRLRHATSGEYHWFEDSVVPVVDKNGEVAGLAGVAKDVTDLRRMEADAKRRRDELESLLDAMPDGVLLAGSDGRIQRTNTGVERILGWSAAELSGKPVETLLPESQRARHVKLREGYLESPSTRRMGTYELSALHKDGTQVPVDIMLSLLQDGESMRVLVIIRDMTEYRRAKAAAAYLASVAKSSDDSIIGCDNEGVIVSWNRGSTRLFGYTEKEAVGKHLVLLYPKELQDECFNSLAKIQRGEHPGRFETKRVRKDGVQFDASVIVSPIEDSQGRLLGMSSICRDVTDRIRAEVSLQMAKRAAEAASQAKSEFLTNMSHELRTPLNGILGLAEVLAHCELSDEERNEHLELIENSGRSLLLVLEQILEMAKLQSGKFLLRTREFSLRECVDGTMRDFAGAAREKGLELEWRIDADVPELVAGDPDCLRQVLSNLMSNALKFTDKGRIALQVQFGTKEAGTVLFTLRDTGVGIPPGRQRSIFEPFSQVDNSLRRRFGGTGLGLAICAQLVEMMGGGIWVNSDGINGSEFQFSACLAATAGTVKAAARAEEPAVSIWAERRREERQPVDDWGHMRVLRPFSPALDEIWVIESSEFGLRVRANRELAAGALVQINVRDTVAIAEVRHCQRVGSGFRIGMERVLNRGVAKGMSTGEAE